MEPRYGIVYRSAIDARGREEIWYVAMNHEGKIISGPYAIVDDSVPAWLSVRRNQNNQEWHTRGLLVTNTEAEQIHIGIIMAKWRQLFDAGCVYMSCGAAAMSWGVYYGIAGVLATQDFADGDIAEIAVGNLRDDKHEEAFRVGVAIGIAEGRKHLATQSLARETLCSSR